MKINSIPGFIQHLQKLKYFKRGRNLISTFNNDMSITIFYDDDVRNCTDIHIKHPDGLGILDLNIPGNIVDKFVVISDFDYVIQRLKPEI